MSKYTIGMLIVLLCSCLTCYIAGFIFGIQRGIKSTIIYMNLVLASRQKLRNNKVSELYPDNVHPFNKDKE